MNKKRLKLIIFCLIVVAVVVLNHFYGWSDYLSDMDNLMIVKEIANDNLLLALLLYSVITIIGCVVLALPGLIFAVLSGMLFGVFWGILACLVATTIGAMAAFLVGRFFLQDSIKPMLEKNRVMKNLLFSNNEKNEFIVLMITRMVPIFPYNLQNFAYGITDIGFIKYSVLTFVFMLPGVAFFTIGAAGITADGNKGVYFVVAAVLALAVTLAGVFIKKKYLSDDDNDDTKDGTELQAETMAAVIAEGAEECIHCGLCTKNCLFLEKYDIDLAGLAKRADLAYSCFLCGKCTAVCPKDIDGAGIAIALRERLVAEGHGADKAKAYNMLLWEKRNYKFANYKKGGKKSVLFPGCNFPSFCPKTMKKLEGIMAAHDIGVVYDCCCKPVYELGLKDDAMAQIEKMITKLHKLGAEELIMLCPNCYSFLQGKIDIPIVSVYEKLAELGELRQLEPLEGFIHYPCPDRESKEFFRSIEPLLPDGTELRPSAGQCCGLGGCAAAKEPELSTAMVSETCDQVGDKKLYTYCASCISNFRRKGIGESHHLLPLLLGVAEEVPTGLSSLINRAKKKF